MAISNTSINNTNTDIYVSSGETCVVSAFFCNHDNATAITFSLYLVPSGGSVGTGSIILKNISLNASDTYIFNTERMVLGNGDKLVAIASNTGLVTATISYSSI